MPCNLIDGLDSLLLILCMAAALRLMSHNWPHVAAINRFVGTFTFQSTLPITFRAEGAAVPGTEKQNISVERIHH